MWLPSSISSSKKNIFMRNSGQRNFRRPIVYLWLLGCVAASAQTQIPVHFEPKPGQTIHLTTTQDFSMAAEAAEIRTAMSLTVTQTNGNFDELGRMESQLTIDAIEMK